MCFAFYLAQNLGILPVKTKSKWAGYFVLQTITTTSNKRRKTFLHCTNCWWGN